MTTYFEHNARQRETFQPRESDTVQCPDILVTEEEFSEDTFRRFMDAKERQALELLP